jgi:hypothetical protein
LRHAALHGTQKDTFLTTSIATRTAALTKDYQYGISDPELPMEYAVELNRLITVRMEGSIG